MSRRTEKQSEASRRNGAKSQGPITPKGKKKSSLNALIHGLTSHQAVLPHEDEGERTAHTEAYMDRFKPRDKVEIDLVKQIADAAWEMERMANMEASVLKLHAVRNHRYADEQFTNLDDIDYVAFGFGVLVNTSTSLPLLLRYRASARSTYRRALDTLTALKRQPDAPAKNRDSDGAAPEYPGAPPLTWPPGDQIRTGSESPARDRCSEILQNAAPAHRGSRPRPLPLPAGRVRVIATTMPCLIHFIPDRRTPSSAARVLRLAEHTHVLHVISGNDFTTGTPEQAESKCCLI